MEGRRLSSLCMALTSFSQSHDSRLPKWFLLNISRNVYSQTRYTVPYRRIQVKFTLCYLDPIFKITGHAYQNSFCSISQEIFDIGLPNLVHHGRIQVKFAPCDLELIFKVTGPLLQKQFPLIISRSIWPRITKLGTQVHHGRTQTEFAQRDIDLIFKVTDSTDISLTL